MCLYARLRERRGALLRVLQSPKRGRSKAMWRVEGNEPGGSDSLSKTTPLLHIAEYGSLGGLISSHTYILYIFIVWTIPFAVSPFMHRSRMLLLGEINVEKGWNRSFIGKSTWKEVKAKDVLLRKNWKRITMETSKYRLHCEYTLYINGKVFEARNTLYWHYTRTIFF